MTRRFGPLRIDPWFFALMAAACYLGGQAPLLLAAAALHEAGHLLALWGSGNGVAQVRLNGSGVRILPRYRRLPPLHVELTVLAAGPLAGLLAAFLLHRPYAAFARMNLWLSLFNLLPAPGLDGGSLLQLCCERLPGRRAAAVQTAVGLLCAAAMAAAGFGLLPWMDKNPLWLYMAAFLLLAQRGGGDEG